MRRFARRSKHGNQITECDGYRFHSAAEARFWMDLRVRERCGEIVELRRQVRFPLIVNGEVIGSYVADMTYVERDSGEYIVADVKSAHTRTLPAWRRTKKLFRACYGYSITEVIR